MSDVEKLNTFNLYQNLITLPVYNGLKKEQLDFVIDTVIESYQHIFADAQL